MAVFFHKCCFQHCIHPEHQSSWCDWCSQLQLGVVGIHSWGLAVKVALQHSCGLSWCHHGPLCPWKSCSVGLGSTNGSGRFGAVTQCNVPAQGGAALERTTWKERAALSQGRCLEKIPGLKFHPCLLLIHVLCWGFVLMIASSPLSKLMAVCSPWMLPGHGQQPCGNCVKQINTARGLPKVLAEFPGKTCEICDFMDAKDTILNYHICLVK